MYRKATGRYPRKIGYSARAYPKQVRKVYNTKSPVYNKKIHYSRYTGARPAYTTTSNYLAPALATAGGIGGMMLGGPLGAAGGAAVGGMAGQMFKSITGYGDYKIKSNSLVMGRPPSVHNKTRSGGSVFVSHKEFIMDVVSSSTANTFNIQEFPVQPGVSLTFPWLSQVAAQFQEYRFHGVVFHFRSMSADALNSTNTALGQVIMSTEYNAAAPPFESKPEMENAQFSNSIKPSESCLHLIECARSASVLSNLYVRTDDVDTAAQDVRFYDLCNFFIATNGCQGTSVNLGELWVSYEVELLKPKIWGELGEQIDFYSAYTLTGITNALPMGTAGVINSINSNIDVTVSASASSQTVTFPISAVPKTYIVYRRWKGTRTASLNPPTTTLYNMAAVSGGPFLAASTPTFNNTSEAPDNNANSDSLNLIDLAAYRTTGNGTVPSITMGSAGTLPASATSFNIIIWQIPNTCSFE